ncbi:A24 family peptidase [Metallibacterium sp.]|uniref:prepilin peptidase n=2 Tax=Metallibacterium sp. TaxID=2940281 RepID=UPI00262DC213|nr:A24 family peptidase [Metallibacterium sp.]
MTSLDALPTVDWIVAAGVLGLLVGSFLNVVILRLPERLLHGWRREAEAILAEARGEDAPEPAPDTASANAPPGIVREPSHCPQCKHRLAARDNIPLLSWLLLRGRCRYCKAPISIQYPLVELLTGVLSAVTLWHFGANAQGAAAVVFTWVLIAASGIDLRTQLLPDQLTLPLLWLGLLLALAPVFVAPEQAILGAALGYLALWSVYWAFKLLTGKEGMGYGDFKLLAALGAWMGAWALLPIVLISSIVGALIGSLYLALSRKGHGVPIPFGPYLAIAGWIWLLAGSMLAHWYLGFFMHG